MDATHPDSGGDARTRDTGGPDSRDADTRFDAGHDGDASHIETDDSGGYVDAGYYLGDGSFFADGAYPDVGRPTDARLADAPAVDATSGCGALSACCGTLTQASQPLCESIVASGNADNCSVELGELQSEGSCTGASVLATQVQLPPNLIVSDGTLLFWTTTSNPGLLSMPVGGGAIKTILEGPITHPINFSGTSVGLEFLDVDDINIYVLDNGSLLRIPKDGAPATLMNETGANVVAATNLGGAAYWAEVSGVGTISTTTNIKSSPLLAGSVSLVATFVQGGFSPTNVAVTSSTAFAGGFGEPTYDVPVGTTAPGTMPAVVQTTCDFATSDNESIYCAQATGSNLVIASDGTTATLGPAANTMQIVFDDTYAYWVDNATVGTINKAPKAGGGPVTVLAHDTNPTAIAVDANSVYWGDQGGYIKSIPK